MSETPRIAEGGAIYTAALKINEAGTVQFPMVAHAAAIGWSPIPPEAALLKRGGEAEMLFRDEVQFSQCLNRIVCANRSFY